MTRILVVDDHEDNVELLRARLAARGYEIETARDGLEALERVHARAPDLILLDVMMPKLDGIEVVRRLKGNPELPFIPIIMQTALETTEDKVEGLDAGADDYITKPIDFAELEARVKSLLRIKALQEELATANAALRRMSQTDGLTGIDNRRHIEERLTEMFEHSARLNEPLAVVMCDVDHFKSVNDTLGHQAGDAVLRQVADVLRHTAREIDRVGRYGGEEFIVLLPGANLDDAMAFAERVRERVAGRAFAYDGGEVRRTLSAGAAAWPHPEIRHQEALVHAADQALYVAKETGRNRVVAYDSPTFRAHVRPEAADGAAAAAR
ncbi:diguanylate cyclase [Roseisolibacter sp. H3M3-2]|uniref:diguanylate cyclase n=1 Tax=Roseisolibacter sp. H3M3-2 TaxID=3031323 RepID=UPI0023DB56FB|nr:diguanylate cyclase [Roseisolibacter sp. H3M3-2]MDF1505527.1 diguanylate cyclase [Roseisolibacter sp. H3M3-2]